MSCATCHIEEKAFTDGIAVRKGLSRNAPTLTYAGFQKAFFHEGRAGSLEGQIVGVVKNENEFNHSIDDLVDSIQADSNYSLRFLQLYNRKPNSLVIRNAIASYIRSLAPFSSKFDQAMRKEVELTEMEIEGFNLFTGKAACATCHFPPLFNGTVPPQYQESEFENLGTPEHLDKPWSINPDIGRMAVFDNPARKHFFKTPTVRNSEQTAPYMHNGVFETLEELMDFYNNGGLLGTGVENELQTLPGDSLHLTQKEIQSVIAFLKTLND